MNFIEKLDALREEKGINKTQMLEDCCLSQNAYLTWKHGGMPRKATLKVIADYFNVPIDFFYDDCGEARAEEVSSMPWELNILSDEERIIVNAYRSASTEGKFRIVQVCMNEQDASQENAAI